LSGGGAAGAAIRAHDWSASPLGEPRSWPTSLRVAVSLMLRSPQPTYIAWGPEQISLYNDGYIPICGDKHPAGIGMPAHRLWAEVWDELGPLNARVMRGESLWFQDMPFNLAGRGREGPSYFTFTYTPLTDEHGQVHGIFCSAAETTERVMAEARRKRQADRSRQMLEQAPSFICIFRGPDNVFEYVNAAHRELFGSADWVGRPLREILPKDPADVVEGQLNDVKRTGRRVLSGDQSTAPWALPGRNAEIRYVDFVYAPLVDEDGSVGGIFCEGFDTTERRRAQNALRDSEEQLRLATDAAEVGLWDYDVRAETIYWPARVKAMFGLASEGPVSIEDFYAAIHPEDMARVEAAFRAAMDPVRRAVYEEEFRTIGVEDGVLRWVAAKGRGMFNARDVCVRVLGTAIDITERKRAETRLNELNETLERRVAEALAERKLLADIVEATDAFVQVCSLDHRWLAINKAAADEFERIFGRRPVVGQDMRALTRGRPNEAAELEALWSRALSGEEFTEVGLVSEAEGERFYEVRFNVLRDKDGRQIGAYEFAHDVTERLRAQARLAETEEALRQAQKLEAMGQLTGGVAHDFNNLLTPIVGGLDMLQRRQLGGPREQRIIAGALQSAERAKTLVQRLLAFARRQPLQPCAVDVGALIRGMADLVASTTGPQIKVTVDIAPDLPPAQADANQLEMAILNLSVNARDAMETGGALRISADARTVGARHPAKLSPGRYVRISVADTGAGMEPAVAARAIEPFFSTKGVGKGTGLGLSMAHGLASQLGGALTISSQVGVGTNVELWLPQSADMLAEGDAPAAGQPERGQAGRVLLVDDEELVRLSAADMLGEIGFEVVEAASAEEALRMIDAGLKFDALVTDHLMPGMSGVELAYIVRERRPEARILVVSGFAETEGIAPDLPRLSKPFRQADLAAMLGDSGC
jgi:PAS domain S-box-containing protein